MGFYVTWLLLQTSHKMSNFLTGYVNSYYGTIHAEFGASKIE